MDDEAIRLMKQRGTYLVADIYNGDYIATEGGRAGLARGVPAQERRDDRGPAQKASARLWRPACKIAYGTDSGVYPHGWNARQLPYMVRYGLTPMAGDSGRHPGGRAQHRLGGSGRLARARESSPT